VDEKGRINTTIVAAKLKTLLSTYQELGFVYLELAHSGTRTYYDNALMVFANLLTALGKDTKGWWVGKYTCFLIMFERGNEGDFKQADIGIDNLQRNYPDFDGGKYGLKEKFLKLKGRIKDQMPVSK
jgi:hypothetical protein